MVPTVVFAVVLVLLAAGLVASHVRAFRAAKARGERGQNFEFARRQFRRRIQASSILGLLGVAILVGPLIESPLASVFYWEFVVLLACWMGVLALADLRATHYHYGLERDQHRIDLAKMKAELEPTAARERSAADDRRSN